MLSPLIRFLGYFRVPFFPPLPTSYLINQGPASAHISTGAEMSL